MFVAIFKNTEILIQLTKFQNNCGTYTTQSYGESSNSNIKYDKSSSSMSLISRKLLTPDEVLKIENPFALVMIAGKKPAITNIPDISEIYFNELNGMGTKEQNQILRIEREKNRKERPIRAVKIWNIWDNQTKDDEDRIELIKDKFQKNIKGEL